ncbi:MAG: hypothetical protein V2J24_05340 [Pseudomonadales bacterium]|nr:hypothetical protein [Pseudomonadales bacterium]
MERSTQKRRGSGALTGSLIAAALLFAAQLATAESEYAAAWGPSVGTMAPLLAATDQDGLQQSLDTLKGPNGLLVVFNRSVDW